MNKQEKFRNGVLVGRGIQWCDYSANAVKGCFHRCTWEMPDGSTAECYAGDVATGVASHAYPFGFEHHYWDPRVLDTIARVQQPSKVFINSMSDLFGKWVPEEQTRQVLDFAETTPHTLQSLTKAAPRLLKFGRFPDSMWVGVSSPPDSMFGKALTRVQQEKMLHRTLEVLSTIDAKVTWISFEPLSWDVADIVAQYPDALKWAVIGAATNGPTVYQPNPDFVTKLLAVLDEQQVPVFFKGNLWGSPAAPAAAWREFFPSYVPSRWQGLIRAGRLDAHAPQKTPVRVSDIEVVAAPVQPSYQPSGAFTQRGLFE